MIYTDNLTHAFGMRLNKAVAIDVRIEPQDIHPERLDAYITVWYEDTFGDELVTKTENYTINDICKQGI